MRKPARIPLPWLAAIFASLCLSVPSKEAAACDVSYYVVPTGTAGGSGTLGDPWRTLPYAVAQVHGLPKNQNICVNLRGGTYFLTSTLTFTGGDSADDGYQISYQAYPGETPVISGGQSLTNWGPDGDRYKVTLTPQQATNLCDPPDSSGLVRCFRQLYVNGERAIRARWPNLGTFSRIVDWDPRPTHSDYPACPSQACGGAGQPPCCGSAGAPACNDVIDIPSADAQGVASWTGVEMVIEMSFSAHVVRVHSGATSGAITPEAVERDRYWNHPYVDAPTFCNQPYHLENALGFLDAPGEWYAEVSPPTGQQPSVYYKPRAGETFGPSTPVMAPQVETLIQLVGDPVACPHFEADCVQNLQFSGITFEYTTWRAPNQVGFIEYPQATEYWVPPHGNPLVFWDQPPAAISLSHARGITLRRNVLRHLGGAGINAKEDDDDIDIVGNVVTDVGAAGVAVGVLIDMILSTPPVPPDSVSVHDNSISYTGQDYRGGVGILVGTASHTLVEHNDIAHVPYSGMNVGWDLRDGSIPNEPNNTVRYNHIHNVMELLGDGAGVYTQAPGGGAGEETIVEQNYVHDLQRSASGIPGTCTSGDYCSPLAGVYLDGSEPRKASGHYTKVLKNVLLDAKTNLPLCSGQIGGDSENVFVQSGATFGDDVSLCDDPTITLVDNDGEHGAVRTGAGLEARYRDIAPGPTPGSFVTRLSLGTPRNNYTGRVGYRITVGSRPLTVRKIGRFRLSGNIGTHTLRITPISGSGECSASLQAASPAVDALGFQYATLAVPCVLAANASYRVTSDETSGGDYWYNSDNRIRTESGASIIGETTGPPDPPADPTHGYGPVNIVYDGQKLIPSVTSEGSLRSDAGTWGMKLQVGSNDLYVLRLGRYFAEGNNQSHVLRLYNGSGQSLASATVGMGSTDTVDELGFKYANLGSGVRLSRQSLYFLTSDEAQGQDEWYDDDTQLQPPGLGSGGQINPASYDGTWHDLTQLPGQSYGPVNAVAEMLNRALPCPGGGPACSTLSGILCNGYRQGMRISVPPNKTLTVTEIGRQYFACSGNTCNGVPASGCVQPTENHTHTLAIYSATTGTPLIASTTLNPASAPLDVDSVFQYATLSSPVVLTPGNYYVTDESQSTDGFGRSDTVVVPGSDISDVRPVSFNALSGQWTVGDPTTVNHSYGAMNLIYYVKSF